MSKEVATIQVVIRKRPINQKQLANQENDCIAIPTHNKLILREPKSKVDLTRYIDEHRFIFDRVYNENETSQEIYNQSVKPLIFSAFDKMKISIFAFGQTGSGKTFTMNGSTKSKNIPGIYTYSGREIFNCIKFNPSFLHLKIYSDKVYDLLNNRKELNLRQDHKGNVNIVGATNILLQDLQSYNKFIKKGMSLRITSQNGTNSQSSRSHAILQLSLMDQKKQYSKLSFIDLAGCQRGSDTLGQSKQTKIDGAQINKSLLALKQCIRALDQKNKSKPNGKYIPFRSSKLTMILKDSLTNNCKTLMIGNISPASGSCQNTLNTLRYSERVKSLKQTFDPNGQSKQDKKSRQLGLTRLEKNKVSVKYDQDDQLVSFDPRKQQKSVEKNKRISLKQQNSFHLSNGSNRFSLNSKPMVQDVSPTKYLLDNRNIFSKSNSKKNTMQIRHLSSMTAFDYRRWEQIFSLFGNFTTSSLAYFQELFIQSKQYLERQLNSYICLKQQSFLQQNVIQSKQKQIIERMYGGFEFIDDSEMYSLITQMKELDRRLTVIGSATSRKLQEYQSYLFKHQNCQRKLNIVVSTNYVSEGDDEKSLIDQINSEIFQDDLMTKKSRYSQGYYGDSGSNRNSQLGFNRQMM